MTDGRPSEGVRAELREAAQSMQSCREGLLWPDDVYRAWVEAANPAAILALLAERDALAERLAQAEQRAAEHEQDAREWQQSTIAANDAAARAGQREARVRALIAAWEDEARNGHGAYRGINQRRAEDLAAALNEGDADA